MIKVPTSGKVLAIGDSEVCMKVSSRQTSAGHELVLNNVPAGGEIMAAHDQLPPKVE